MTGGLSAQSPDQVAQRVTALLRDLADRDRAAAAVTELNALCARAGDAMRQHQPDFRRAISETRAALAAVQPEYRAWYEHYVASTATELGLYALARDQLQLGLADLEGEGSFVVKARLLLGELQQLLGEPDAALTTVERVLPACEGAVRADAVGLRGRVHVDLGLFGTAHGLLEQQMKLARASRSPMALRKALVYRAEYYLAAGRARQALQFVDACEEAAPELELIRGLAQAVLALEDPTQDPRAELERVLERDNVPHSVRARALVALARVAMRRGDLEAADRWLAQLRRDAATWPWLVAEMETLSSRRIRLERASPAQLLAQLRRLQRAVAGLFEHARRVPLRRGGAGFLTQRYRRQALSELFVLARSALGEERGAMLAVETLLTMQTLGSSAREMRVAPVGIEEVRRRFLRPRHGVMVFLAAQDASHLIAFDRDVVRHWILGGWLEITAQTDGMRAELGQVRRASELVKRGRDLATLLLPGEARTLLRSWEVVTVADHGLLRGVPFECLVLDGEQIAGQVVGVNTLSSLPVGVHLLARHAPAAVLTVDVLATLRGKESGRLRRSDVARLTKPYASARERLGEEVSVEVLAGWDFSAAVTEILAHGGQSRADERRGGLLLSPGSDGFFGCAQADGLRVAGLIVLSSCESGRGRLRVGDEGYHATLGGSFLRAGAHTVVQSAGELRLAEQLALMERVHARLVAGECPALALCRARRALAAEWVLDAQIRQAQVQVYGLGVLPLR